MKELEKDAACAIREVLYHGGTLEAIALELGKLAILYPIPCLPTNYPLFHAQTGLEMGQSYQDGIVHVIKLVDLSD